MNTIIIGMGALGLLFGRCIADNAGKDHIYYLMDSDRYRRHKDDIYRLNGERMEFNIIDTDMIKELPFKKADLVMIATKYGGLREAVDMMKDVTGDDTVIVSLLNGIISEDIIAETYKRENIIDCVPIGMDAMRDGCSVDYTQIGKLQIGIRDASQKDAYSRLTGFFNETKIPYESVDDIRHAMWNKFMINVGINQTCMVYGTTYSGAMNIPEAAEDLKGAMQEVVKLAELEGVSLTKEDYDNDIRILSTLKPDSYPSMRQDAVAGRYSEVELFAGTMLSLAQKHGIELPVNRRYYDRIKEIESGYPNIGTR